MVGGFGSTSSFPTAPQTNLFLPSDLLLLLSASLNLGPDMIYVNVYVHT